MKKFLGIDVSKLPKRPWRPLDTLFMAKHFGQYVEVNKPTLQYKAYIWRGNYYFISGPTYWNVRKKPEAITTVVGP